MILLKSFITQLIFKRTRLTLQAQLNLVVTKSARLWFLYSGTINFWTLLKVSWREGRGLRWESIHHRLLNLICWLKNRYHLMEQGEISLIMEARHIDKIKVNTWIKSTRVWNSWRNSQLENQRSNMKST
jgi:hypothetical protein